MNKERRKTITDLSERIQALKSDIESVRDEEQEYLDAMPENMQSGDKGDAAQQAIENLESAIQSLDEAESNLDAAAE